MRLHCLGTAGYHPNAKRHTSCYFLPEPGILLDAGSGLFRLAPLIQANTLDILLSHAHLDHTLGLTFLLDVLYQRKVVYGQPIDHLRIWGEAEKLDAIRRHLFSELIFPVQLERELGAQWQAIDDLAEFSIGATSITWRAQQHPGGSVAYRIEWPSQRGQPTKKLVYASDTSGDLSEAALRWSEEADLLMHECYFRDEDQAWAEKTGHCWTSRLAEIVRQCRPAGTLVTHVSPLECGDDPIDIGVIEQASGDGQVWLATDEQIIDF